MSWVSESKLLFEALVFWIPDVLPSYICLLMLWEPTGIRGKGRSHRNQHCGEKRRLTDVFFDRPVYADGDANVLVNDVAVCIQDLRPRSVVELTDRSSRGGSKDASARAGGAEATLLGEAEGGGVGASSSDADAQRRTADRERSQTEIVRSSSYRCTLHESLVGRYCEYSPVL